MKNVVKATSVLLGAAGSALLVGAGAVDDMADLLFPGSEISRVPDLTPSGTVYSGNVTDFAKFKEDKENQEVCDCFDDVDETGEFVAIDDEPHLVLRSGANIFLLDANNEIYMLDVRGECENCDKIRDCIESE